MNIAGQETGSNGPPKVFLSCGIRTNQLSFPPTGRVVPQILDRP